MFEFKHDAWLIGGVIALAFFAWFIFVFNQGSGVTVSQEQRAVAQEQKMVEAEIKTFNTVSGSDSTDVIEDELMATDLDDLDRELADIDKLLDF